MKKLVDGRVVDMSAQEVTAYEAARAAAAPQALFLRVQNEVQRRLDTFAQSRRYDGIVSLCSYAASGVAQRQAEALRGVTMRDALWDAAIALEAAVLAGGPLPTYEAAMATIPVPTWGNV